MAEFMTFKYASAEFNLVLCELLTSVTSRGVDVMNSTSPVQAAARAKKDVAAPALLALMPIN